MTKETRQWIMEAALECLAESEELFVYVVLPLLCVAVVCAVGIGLFHLVFDPSATNMASTLDALSIDPAKRFPPS